MTKIQTCLNMENSNFEIVSDFEFRASNFTLHKPTIPVVSVQGRWEKSDLNRRYGEARLDR